MQKIRKKSTPRKPQNELFNRVLANLTVKSAREFKNGVERDSRRVLAIFLDHIREEFVILLEFSRIFVGPFSSRYSQSL